MRTLPTFAFAGLVSVGAIFVVGCSSSSKDRGVTSIQELPYYEVYDAGGNLTSAGYGTYPYATRPYSRQTAGSPGQPIPLASSGSRTSAATAPAPTPYQPVSAPRSSPRKSPSSLLSEVRVRKEYISRSARGRRNSRSMSPRYITIHSTQNWSKGADAYRHSLALKNSKLGKLSWHYTTDENVAVQHLPTSITGNHADYDGPGNRYSIGIEMCEHPGNSRTATVNRTAKLAAYLMYKHDIPISRVVPHYHWPRPGHRPAHKNCPHFLLDNGRPGAKWRGFLSKVKGYHRDITSGGAVYASR